MKIGNHHSVATHHQYLENGKWKCDKSPTGAHHWIIKLPIQTCIYCKEKKSSNAIVWETLSVRNFRNCE